MSGTAAPGIALGLLLVFGLWLLWPRASRWVRERNLEGDLLRKCRGDRTQFERLVAAEEARNPAASRAKVLQLVIDRWERANR
jgi:hypothetical protein